LRAISSNEDRVYENLILLTSSPGRWCSCMEGHARHLHFRTVSLPGKTSLFSQGSGNTQYGGIPPHTQFFLAFTYCPLA